MIVFVFFILILYNVNLGVLINSYCYLIFYMVFVYATEDVPQLI